VVFIDLVPAHCYTQAPYRHHPDGVMRKSAGLSGPLLLVRDVTPPNNARGPVKFAWVDPPVLQLADAYPIDDYLPVIDPLAGAGAGRQRVCGAPPLSVAAAPPIRSTLLSGRASMKDEQH
jgi:hypothetical protein